MDPRFLDLKRLVRLEEDGSSEVASKDWVGRSVNSLDSVDVWGVLKIK